MGKPSKNNTRRNFTIASVVIIILMVGGAVGILIYNENQVSQTKILNPDTFYISTVPGASAEDNIDYEPKNAIVTLGVNNKVVWTNDDTVAHNLHLLNPYQDPYGKSFGSELIQPGETYEFLFTAPVTLNYHCMPHPWMQGTITVE